MRAGKSREPFCDMLETPLSGGRSEGANVEMLGPHVLQFKNCPDTCVGRALAKSRLGGRMCCRGGSVGSRHLSNAVCSALSYCFSPLNGCGMCSAGSSRGSSYLLQVGSARVNQHGTEL